MSVWRANLAALREHFPEVADRLESAAPRPAPVRSPEDSAILAARWLHGRRIGAGAFLAVSGFGDGSHVRALLGLLPPRATLFVGEAEPAFLRSVLERVDLRETLADPRLLLGVGPVDDLFFSPVRPEHVLGMSDVQPLLYAPAFNLAPEYYERFFLEFARKVDFRRKLEGTRLKDAPMWQANTFANLPLLADAPDLGALRDVFRGRAMVLVSAGPSLDESMDFLRQARQVAVVVAVNSSYRALRHAGIVPHLVLAADPREYTARGFRGVPVDATWLVATPIVNPEVVGMFAGRTFIWSGANELFTAIRRRCGLEPGSRIVEQGTVSACAVDLAVIFGCDRLVLVGQDLAIRPDGQSHVSDSIYTDMRANRVDPAACRRVPGNTLPEVFVEEKLFVYLKTFEQLVLHHPTLRYLNTSRLGARIAGIPYRPFDAALRWMGAKSVGDVPAALAKRCIRKPPYALRVAQVRESLAPTARFAREALAGALTCAARCEAVPEAMAGAGPAESAEVKAALEALRALEQMLASNPEEYAILESGLTRLELFKTSELQKRLTGLPEHWGRIVYGQDFGWGIAEGAWFLLNHLDRFFAATPRPAAPASFVGPESRADGPSCAE